MKFLKNIDWFFVIIYAMLGFAVIMIFATESNRAYDDTDSLGERSGLVLYTDQLTGCQYLEGGIVGGLVNRVDGEGNHIGCKPPSEVSE